MSAPPPRHLIGVSDLRFVPEIYWRRRQALPIEHLGGPRDGEWTELRDGELVTRIAQLPSAGGFYLLGFTHPLGGGTLEPCWRWIQLGRRER